MNAMLNINIRVSGAQAIAQLRAMQGQVNALATGAGSGASKVTSLQSALSLTSLEKFGKNLQWTGRQLQYNFTLPLALAGGAATKFALDNERALVGVRKVYGDLTDSTQTLNSELDALSTSFELLSSRYGVQQKQVIGIAEGWAQAGASGVGLAKITKLTMDTMILGQMDATKATEGLLAIQSAYGLNTDQLRDSVAQLNIIENQTSIEFPGLIDVIGRAGGVARVAGVDIRHLAAMAASLVPATGSAAQAGNALRTILSRLTTPTKDASDIFAKMGIDIFAASWQAANGVEKMEMLARSFENLSQAQKNTVSSIIASRWQINRFDVLMADIAKSLDKSTASQSSYAKALEITKDQSYANRIYAQELTQVLSSQPQAFKILMTTMQNALAKAILPMIPAFLSLASYATHLVVAFTRLSPQTQNLILGFLLLLAAVGPIARYVGALIQLFTVFGRAIQGVHWLFSELVKLFAGAFKVFEYLGDGVVVLGKGFIWLGDAIWSSLSAVFGPIVRIGVAALGQLLTYMGTIAVSLFGRLATLMGGFGTGVAGVLSTVVGAVSRVVLASLAQQAAWVASFFGWIGSGASAVLSAVGRVLFASLAQQAMWVSAFFGRVSSVYYAVYDALVAGLTTALEALVALGGGALVAIQGAISGIMTVITATLAQQAAWVSSFFSWLSAAAVTVWEGMTAGFTAAVEFITQAVVAADVIITRMMVFIEASMSGLITFMSTIPELILAAFTSPWTAVVFAIIAAVSLIAFFMRSQLGDVFDWIARKWQEFPRSLLNIFRTVIDMFKTMALAVKHWMGYLNPFQRHSPSLVDNVHRGINTITDKYDSLSSVPGTVQQAIDVHRTFNEVTAPARSAMQAADNADTRNSIVGVAPNAGPAVDKMVASITRMKTALELVNVELTKQQNLVDDMQRQIDQDMKPYNDAIFANEQAQKRLRLEILKLGQSGQSVDDLKAKFSSLQGEIEGLRSMQQDLRQAGAGSDILNTFDQQVNALQAQQDAISNMGSDTSGITDLQKQLDDLQRTGEMLNLQKDLEFDPKLKALDEQKAKLDDLKGVYSDINTQIGDMQQALDDMASSAKKATDSQSQAQQLFDAGAGQNFDVPGGNAIPGLGREGGLADIQAFNDQMQKELDDALKGMGGVDMFKPIKDAWNATWGWLKTNVGPVVKPVIDAIGTAFGSLGDLFSGIHLGNVDAVTGTFKTIGDVLGSVANLVSHIVGPVFDWLGTQLVKMGGILATEFAKWAPLGAKVQEAFGHIVHLLDVVFNGNGGIVWMIKNALKIIQIIWDDFWPLIKAVLSPIFSGIAIIIGGFFQILRGIFTFFLDLINGDWSKLWGDLMTIFGGFGNIVLGVIVGVFGAIWGAIKFVVTSIYDVFVWLYDELVGHSVIPDLVNGILQWFELMGTVLTTIWQVLWTAVTWLWDNIAKPLIAGIGWFIQNVLVPAFQVAFDIIKTVVSDAFGVIEWIWDHILKPVFDAIWDVITNVLAPVFKVGFEGAQTAFSLMGDGLKVVWDKVIKPVFDGIDWALRNVVGPAFTWLRDNVIKPVWDGITNIISGAWNGIKSLMETGINAFVDAFNTLAGVINKIAGALHLGISIGTFGHVNLTGSGNSNVGNANKLLMASGGVVGANGSGWITNGVSAIVGEGNPNYPEFVIPTDPAHRANALKLFQNLGGKLFVGGGIFGGLGDAIGWIGDKIGAVTSFASDVRQVATTFAQNKLSFMGDIGGKIIDYVIEWAKTTLGSLNPFAMGGMIPSAANGAIVRARAGGTLVRVAEAGRDEAISPLPSDFSGPSSKTYNFYGNLSFPNITDPADVDEFISNLEALAGS